MPRIRPSLDPTRLEALSASGDDAPSLESKVDFALTQIAGSTDQGRGFLQVVIDQMTRGRAGLEQVRGVQEELRKLLALAGAPPWYPAIFLRRVPGDELARALVVHAGQPRVVAVGDQIDPESLIAGEEVYLGKEINLIVAKSPFGLPQCGETAHFERRASGNRCVLRWRDEEVVVDMSASLLEQSPEAGDQVRWDRAAWMAFEKIERAAGRQYFVDDVEDIDAGRIGGQDAALRTILSVLTGVLVEPELARSYGLSGCQSLLMEGPPGCGKTLMAKAAAAAVRRASGRRCCFAVVKPGEWLSPWVGETEQNIRNTFRALSEAARDAYAILFLDEVESIGRIRGGTVSHHGDVALACLLAELNGFKHRGGVAVIAATNRRDLLDPAFAERLSDVAVTVRRPDMAGASAIFAIHLAGELPWAEPRQALIDTAVSRLYSPNADNGLCTLRFRDGTSRAVVARELVSGRLISQICLAACRQAFDRHTQTGEAGLRVVDMEEAVADAMERLTTTLTRHNIHAYLSDLPQDADVIAVEPVVRRVERPHRYLRAA